MSKLDLEFLEGMKAAPNLPTSTCSFTEPKSLVTGCLDAVQAGSTDIGTLGVGAGSMIGSYLASSRDPVTGMLKTLGAETGYLCAYGAINTAVDNCHTTMTSSLSSFQEEPVTMLPVHKLDHPAIVIADPVLSGIDGYAPVML